jgi:hypothetical protein
MNPDSERALKEEAVLLGPVREIGVLVLKTPPGEFTLMKG